MNDILKELQSFSNALPDQSLCSYHFDSKYSKTLETARSMLWEYAFKTNNQCLKNICYDLDVAIDQKNCGILLDVQERIADMIENKIPLCNVCLKIHGNEALTN